jgi:hypothetical protein
MTLRRPGVSLELVEFGAFLQTCSQLQYLTFPALDCSTEKFLPFERRRHHHYKHQGLGHLASDVSSVTAALANVSSDSQLFSFIVDCSGMMLTGFGFEAFFAGGKVISFCIHLSCLVCIQSVVRGVWSCVFHGH